MPEEYRKVVLDTYKKKKLDGSLSPNLLAPTPGDLREECLIVYRERILNSSDDEILRQFFGPKDQEKGYFTLIENSPAEKFKQMPKILKGKVTNPGIKFIELLAWLIDFQPRTSISYYNSFDKRSEIKSEDAIENRNNKIKEIPTEVTGGHNNEKNEHSRNEEISINEIADNQGDLIEEEEELKNDIYDTGQLIDTKENEKKKTKDEFLEKEYVRLFYPRYIAISCIVLLFIGTTSFAVWERRTKIRLPEPDEKFMYWDGDHYEPVKDGKQNVGAPIIPLNENTLTQQQKITLPDTLTSYSIGKVWYKGHGKDHEFFTASGPYPQDLQRVLKPLTNTILTKYTSNYRYILTRLVWFICAAFFISLCGYGASKLEKEVKPAVKEPDTEEEETTALLGNELQATGA